MRFIFIFLFLSTTLWASECLKTRAVIDIGSAATKFKVAEVDTCTQTILKTLHQSSLALGFKADLSASQDGHFSQGMIEKALIEIENLKNKISADEWRGVATAAFRSAKNGEAVAVYFSEKLAFKISVISQNEEGKLGFFAGVSAYPEFENDKVLVWDIGGASQQLTFMTEKNIIGVSKLQIASVNFKDMLIEKVLGLDPQVVKSPNPILPENLEKSLALLDASSVEYETLISEKTQVIGVGSVHGISLKNRLGQSEYTQNDLAQLFKLESQKNDAEIGGAYASTEVSNIALVLSMMKKLGIQHVSIAEVGIGDGVLLHPDYWESL